MWQTATDLVHDGPNHEEMKRLGKAQQSVDFDPNRRPLHHEPTHAGENPQLSCSPVDRAVERFVCNRPESGLLYVQRFLRRLSDLRVSLRLQRPD